MHKADYITRFAPSPTGALHLGNARTFLIIWLRCRSLGGRLILRLEDLDHPKVKPESTAEIYEDLRWLGLDWDEGPDKPAPGFTPEDYIQSQRLNIYAKYFERLRQQGDIYPCTCSRADIVAAQSAPHAGDELFYPNLCRDKYASAREAEAAAGKTPAWRFHAPQGESVFTDNFCGVQMEDLQLFSGDFVIARDEMHPAYQLAVVVDDYLMNISEVIRADDLLPSTHRQLALYNALGMRPPEFLHVPLVVGEDGRRLAKRHGDTRISHIRAAGVPAERVIGWLAASCGWIKSAEEIAAGELLPRFTLRSSPRRAHILAYADREYLGLTSA